MRYHEIICETLVYRGSDHDNENRSSMAPEGVYVSIDPQTAKQWGQPRAYRLVRTPRLIDLSDWYGIGKTFVAKLLGLNPTRLTRADFHERGR
jgi:hypothetical protein